MNAFLKNQYELNTQFENFTSLSLPLSYFESPKVKHSKSRVSKSVVLMELIRKLG